MKNKGYIYTLVVVILILMVLSLISYYITTSQSAVTDAVSKIRTDEMYYFIESLKSDYGRSIRISSQRSLIYLIDYSIRNKVDFNDYMLENCTPFNYALNGSQAAVAELMLCGTLYGDDDIDFLTEVMENHTILQWQEKMILKGEELNFIVDVNPREIEIIPYDSWSFYIVSKMDLTVSDQLNKTFYRKYDLPVVSKVELDFMEDPIYSLKTGSHDFIRYFTPCGSYDVVNSTTIQSWIVDECYLPSEDGPSFFDRLDGSVNASQKYIDQSERVELLGLEPKTIGLESIINLDEFPSQEVEVHYNNSWFDYKYWNNIPAYCRINDLEEYENFLVDFDHALDYYIQGLNCSVYVNPTAKSFTPSVLWLPVNSTVTWLNVDPALSCILSVDAPGFGAQDLIPTEQDNYLFTEPKTDPYLMSCTRTQPTQDTFYGEIYIK